MSVRDELAGMVDARRIRQPAGEWVVHPNGYYIADAILARFPWMAEEPRLEYGHAERKSDAPFDANFAHVYSGRTRSEPSAWRNVTRYVTPWKEAP